MGSLITEQIKKSYGDKTVIDRISLHLDEGELVCLLGVSGCGKSTLFNVISGLTEPDSGRVLLNGRDVTGIPGEISYMLQKDLLLPYYTVLDNVCLPLLIKNGIKKREAREKAAALFAQFGIDGTQKKYPGELSGGMRQRAALLRTYLAANGVALLDEPFSALDTITKSAMHRWYLDVMREIRLSTLFVTHDIDEAVLLSDRIYIMSGSPGVITAEIAIPKTEPRTGAFLLTDAFLACKRQIIAQLGAV